MEDNTPLEKQVEELAQFLMDEFGGPKESEGAIEMAIRLLNEYKYRDGVIGEDPSGKKIG